MAREQLAEEVPEVGGECEVAALVEPARAEAGPASVGPAAPDLAPEHEREAGMAVVGAAVAVLAHGAAELGHGHQHHVRHAVAEVAVERGEGGAQLAQAARAPALNPAFGRVVGPAAHVCEGHLHSHPGLDELRDLPEAVAIGPAWVGGYRRRLILRGVRLLEELD